MTNWLRRFMYGRNGADQLSFAILFVGILLSISGSLAAGTIAAGILHLLDYICLAVFFYRTLSRNIDRRREENRRFMGMIYPLSNQMHQWVQRLRDQRYYRYMRCPQCKQQLRAPRGKGKIRITCNRCKEAFIRKV